jgi:hypothetical protein
VESASLLDDATLPALRLQSEPQHRAWEDSSGELSTVASASARQLQTRPDTGWKLAGNGLDVCVQERLPKGGLGTSLAWAWCTLGVRGTTSWNELSGSNGCPAVQATARGGGAHSELGLADALRLQVSIGPCTFCPRVGRCLGVARAVCLTCGSHRATSGWFTRKVFTLTLHCPGFVVISNKACRTTPT